MIRVEPGDCLEVMKRLIDEGVQVQSCVTDPPYHLTSIVKRFGAENAAPAKSGKTGAFARASKGFMGKQWDGGDVAFRPETWRLVYDLLTPGAYALVFSGSRTFDCVGAALREAGFIMHPFIAWIFGSGFPKAHKVKVDGEELEGWEGWRYGGQVLKPAIEPILMVQKPFAEKTGGLNVLQHGMGALNVDGCRIPGAFKSGWSESGSKAGPNNCMSGPNYERAPKPDNPSGRWPANVIHDGSEEVLEAFAAYGESKSQQGKPRSGPNGNGWGMTATGAEYSDTGTPARFFFSAKADKSDRFGSRHPTIKPVDLMAYLCRLVTPPGGTVLDPFAGSGTTGAAAMAEGFDAILIEREDEYVADIRARLDFLKGKGPTKAEVKNRNSKTAAGEDTPLFGGGS